jgi:hypothetical protein
MRCLFRVVAIVGGWPENFLIHAKWLGFPDKFLATLILLKSPNLSYLWSSGASISIHSQSDPP